jgi:uncharacterized protein YyaL (SSP411 family)
VLTRSAGQNEQRKLSGRCKVINNLLRLSVCFCLFSAGLASALAAEQEAITWHEWHQASFEQARAAEKLVFVDVGIEGCTACRRMSSQTLKDPGVVRLLNDHFIAIALDAEARPDIGQRYSDWAWPALIFLRADGAQVLAIRGNRTPENFTAILKDLILRQEQGALDPDALAPPAAPSAELTGSLQAIRGQIRGQLDRQLNEQLGSWQKTGMSATSAARLANLRFRAFMYQNAELEALVSRSQRNFMKLIDPVWGGVFQGFYLEGSDLRMVPEKRLAEQAGAMEVFATAYQRTGEVQFRNALAKVDAYLQEWLANGDGTFYTSQQNQPDGLPPHVSPRRYWSLRTAHERRRFGIPPIDHAIYTDRNAAVISAYVHAFAATGEGDYLRTAIQGAQTLLNERLSDDGTIAQAGGSRRMADDERIRPFIRGSRPYLVAQAGMGRALLNLYAATGEETWRKAAEQLADAMIRLLWDPDSGGFFASPPEEGAPFAPQKPLEANALAARFLYDLSVYLKQSEYAHRAVDTLQVVAQPQLVRREGKVTALTGTMLELLAAAYVEVSIVGDPEDPRARQLYLAALRTYHPRKLLHFEAPGRYPEADEPVAYICNPDFCTTPIADPDRIAGAFGDFINPASTAYP